MSEIFGFWIKFWNKVFLFLHLTWEVQSWSDCFFTSVIFHLWKPQKTFQEIPLKISEKLASMCNARPMHFGSYLLTPHIISVIWYGKVSLSFFQNLHRRTKTKLQKYKPINCFVYSCSYFVTWFFIPDKFELSLPCNSQCKVVTQFSASYRLLMTTLYCIKLCVYPCSVFESFWL